MKTQAIAVVCLALWCLVATPAVAAPKKLYCRAADVWVCTAKGCSASADNDFQTEVTLAGPNPQLTRCGGDCVTFPAKVTPVLDGYTVTVPGRAYWLTIATDDGKAYRFSDANGLGDDVIHLRGTCTATDPLHEFKRKSQLEQFRKH